jgi:hypothetical protein
MLICPLLERVSDDDDEQLQKREGCWENYVIRSLVICNLLQLLLEYCIKGGEMGRISSTHEGCEMIIRFKLEDLKGRIIRRSIQMDVRCGLYSVGSG